MILKILTHHLTLIVLAISLTIGGAYYYHQYINNQFHNEEIRAKDASNTALRVQLDKLNEQYQELASQDQIKINQDLQKEAKNIHDNYLLAVKAYEKLVDFRAAGGKVPKLDDQLSTILTQLANKNYASASANLVTLNKTIDDENKKLQASFAIPANVAQSNTPPGSGYSRQKVQISIGEYLVDLIAADLTTTKVIIDTASDNDCGNECPVLNLADYVSRSGAYAGINGSYFCPASYPSCAGKTNSFDTLVMNKNKKYFNSDNNVYSVVPVAVFSSGSARFLGNSKDWGRDTSVDGVIANYPLLLTGGNVNFSGSDDPKQGSKGPRSFIGANGSKVYMGVVSNATVAEAALVLQALGLKDALNLDSGGSTALWSGGYKYGPGRGIPNAVLFVKR